MYDDEDVVDALRTAKSFGVGSRLGTKWTTPEQDEAARQRFIDAEAKPTLIGKALGALGIDASGQRAATPWQDAFLSTLHMPSRFAQAAGDAMTVARDVLAGKHQLGTPVYSEDDAPPPEYVPQVDPDIFARGLNFAGTIASSSPVASVTGAVPTNAAGMFAGRLAKTADHAALARERAIQSGLKHLEDYRSRAAKGDTDDGFGYRIVQGKDIPGYEATIADAKSKALDLSDRARLGRAYDQGYDLVVPGVHGSRSDPFVQFDPHAPRANDSGFYGRGHYFVNRDPDKAGPGYGHINEGYGEASYYGKNVAPYFLKRENPLDLGSYDYTKSELGKVGTWGSKIDELGLATPELKETIEASKRFDDLMNSATVRRYSDGSMQAVVKHPDHGYEIAGVANKGRGEKEYTTETDALNGLRNALYRQLQEDSYWDRAAQTYKKQTPWRIGWEDTPSLEQYVMRRMPWDRTGPELLDGSGRLSSAAKAAGHDSIIYGDETAKFDNKGIRHFDAVFDPAKSDSANLLASNKDAAIPGTLIRSAADDDVVNALRVARSLDPLGYYSQALEAARALKQAKGTPEQMLAQLKSAGVKDAEIEATGLGRLFADKAKAARPEPDGLSPQDRSNGVSQILAETPEYKRAEAAAVKGFMDDLRENETLYFNRHIEYDDDGNSLPLDDHYPSLYRSDWASIIPAAARAVEDAASSLGLDLVLTNWNSGSRYGTLELNGKKYKVRIADHERQSALHDGADFNIAPGSMTPLDFIKELLRMKQSKNKTATPSITRDEIVRHLEENRVGLNQRIYDRSPPNERELANLRRNTGSPDDVLARELGLGDDPSESLDRTKWSNYSLDPSNPTYRETVLHLPQSSSRYEISKPDPKGRVSVRDIQTGDWVTEFGSANTARFNSATDAERSIAQLGGDTSFRSGHFPEPNIIGHMMTSMTKHEGRPVYTIDQIQSDWGQKLRDGGVRDEAKIAELESRFREANTKALAMEVERLPTLTSNGAETLTKQKFGNDATWATLSDEQRYEVAKLSAENAEKNTELNRRMDAAGAESDRLEAEWNTARNSAAGHPLVNTTDQWVNTTLRRALRQAAEADAEYIAVPTGDTVLSYNPGDVNGMRQFYGSVNTPDHVVGIVPKNLRKILEKIDKDAAKPVYTSKVDTPTYGMKGEGFTLFPLTPAIKSKILGEGQPLFANPKSSNLPGTMIRDNDDSRNAIDRALQAASKYDPD